MSAFGSLSATQSKFNGYLQTHCICSLACSPFLFFFFFFLLGLICCLFHSLIYWSIMRWGQQLNVQGLLCLRVFINRHMVLLDLLSVFVAINIALLLLKLLVIIFSLLWTKNFNDYTIFYEVFNCKQAVKLRYVKQFVNMQTYLCTYIYVCEGKI